VRVEAVIHGYPCNRYKQKSRRLLAFLRGVVTPLVTPRRKMENARVPLGEKSAPLSRPHRRK
jgi:hypothetical protein